MDMRQGQRRKDMFCTSELTQVVTVGSQSTCKDVIQPLQGMLRCTWPSTLAPARDNDRPLPFSRENHDAL